MNFADIQNQLAYRETYSLMNVASVRCHLLASTKYRPTVHGKFYQEFTIAPPTRHSTCMLLKDSASLLSFHGELVQFDQRSTMLTTSCFACLTSSFLLLLFIETQTTYSSAQIVLEIQSHNLLSTLSLQSLELMLKMSILCVGYHYYWFIIITAC